MSKIRESLEENLEHYRFRDALKEAMNIARLGNKYLADTEPWKLVKSDQERVKTIMYVALQITANVAIAVEPFMPFTAAKILKLLNASKIGWERLGQSDLIPMGHTIAEPELLFEKIEDSAIEAQLLKLENTKKSNQAAQVTLEPQKATIQFEDFDRMDIRVSKVIAAEKVAKTKKLLKLTVDTGIDRRTIVSGIAEFYTPEEMVGKEVLVLVNLAPRELKGIESQGMILMAQGADGRLRTVAPEEQTGSGAQIG